MKKYKHVKISKGDLLFGIIGSALAVVTLYIFTF